MKAAAPKLPEVNFSDHGDIRYLHLGTVWVQGSMRLDEPFAIELGFTTDDVEGLVNKATANGATLLEPAKQKPWGQTVAYVRDPDGFLVEICTPMG